MQKRRQLTPAELARPYAKYYDRPMTPAPQEIYDLLAKGPIDPKDALPIERHNDILKRGYLPCERGWCMMPDGSAFVAGLTKMPSVTAEMIAWWFAWHGLESLRYMIWDPDDHRAVHVKPEDLEHRLNYNLAYTERNWGTTDVVTEDVESGDVEVYISFLSPSDYGYDMNLFKKEKVLIAVNANTSIVALGGQPLVTFSHVGRAILGGIELRSRFWIGWTIVDRKPVRVAQGIPLPEGMPKALAYHCANEFHNLAAILPSVFAENSKIRDDIKDFR